MGQIMGETSNSTEVTLASEAPAEKRNSSHASDGAAELTGNALDAVGTLADAGEGVAELVSGSFDIGEIAAEAGWLALIIVPAAGILWGAYKVSRAAQRWLEG